MIHTIGLIENKRRSILPFVRRFLRAINVKFTLIKKNLTPADTVKFILNNQLPGLYFTNGTDRRDAHLLKLLKNNKYSGFFLFSELGWLPYQKCYYLDYKGIGNYNFLYNCNPSSIKNKPPDHIIKRYLHDLDCELNKGISVPYGNNDNNKYILCPLQVDGDSKLIIGSPHFKNMKEFIKFIINLVPNTFTILFKNHPKNRRPARIPKGPNIIDITKSNYKKKELIQKATCVIGINSTLLLESLYLKARVCSFGLDIFSNKGFVVDGHNKTFHQILHDTIPNLHLVDNFINEMLARQIYRQGNCGDPNYYKTLFWATQIKSAIHKHSTK